jgi:hypothetical protein
VDIEGYCLTCRRHFDAHWHNYPGEEVKSIVDPKCFYCKSDDVVTHSDEDLIDFECDSNGDDEE